MSRRRKSAGLGEAGGVNMTPMIDIVFQMIIFFVLTVEMERDALDERIRLAMSPHGPAVEKKDPRTVTIDVNDRGHFSIGRVPISSEQLFAIMRRTVADYGQTTPVVIRGDMEVQHENIKRAMDICTRAGLFKVKFAAIKEAN
jgi:biopolymer transport protein ExbD